MSLTCSLNQPNHTLPKATIVTLVILIHAVAFIALNSGFTKWPSVLEPSVFKYINVKPEPPKPDPVPVLEVPQDLMNNAVAPQVIKQPAPNIDIAPEVIPPAISDGSGVQTDTGTSQQVVPSLSRVAVLHRVDPLYPASAERAGEEGIVLLEVQIDSRGKVIGVNVIQSSGFSQLDAAALKAVKQWHFAPVVSGAKVRVPIRFELNSLKY